jgi:Ca2+/H+ antiporter
MNSEGIRRTLQAGAVTFGSSSVLLVAAPTIFLRLLALPTDRPLQWAMRMIGITVFALAGNLWFHAATASSAGLRRVAWLMAGSAAALGVCTLTIPVHHTWFTLLYALVGFGFSASYVTFNLRK